MIITVIGVTKTSIEKNNIATNAPRWIACGTDASAPQQQKIGSSQQVGFHVLSNQKDHKGWVVNQPNKSSEDFLNIIKKSCEKMISWQFCDCDLLGMVKKGSPKSMAVGDQPSVWGHKGHGLNYLERVWEGMLFFSKIAQLVLDPHLFSAKDCYPVLATGSSDSCLGRQNLNNIQRFTG